LKSFGAKLKTNEEKRGVKLKKKVSSGGNCLSPIKLPHYY
jgi:hypothetical protein